MISHFLMALAQITIVNNKDKTLQYYPKNYITKLCIEQLK